MAKWLIVRMQAFVVQTFVSRQKQETYIARHVKLSDYKPGMLIQHYIRIIRAHP